MNTWKKISHLYNIFTDSGLGSILKVFGDYTFNEYDMTKSAHLASGELRYLIDIFVLSQSFNPKKLAELIGKDITEILINSGMAVSAGKKMYKLKVRLASFKSGYLFLPTDTVLNSFVQTNNEIVSLIPSCKCQKLRKILVLFPIFGAEIIIAKYNNPDAEIFYYCHHDYTNIIKLNLMLNSVNAKECKTIDSHKKQKYDMILSSPPYIPSFEPINGFNFDFGRDGTLGVIKTLRLATELLSRNGVLYLISGYNFKNQDYKKQFERLLRSYKYSGTLFLTSKYQFIPKPGSLVFNQTLSIFASQKKLDDLRELSKEISAYAEANNINWSALFFCLLKKSNDASKLEVVDYTNDYYGNWLL